MRFVYQQEVQSVSFFKQQLLQWLKNEQLFCYLDNNEFQQYQCHHFELLVGIGSNSSIKVNYGNAFEQLNTFFQQKNDWLFGHLGYDLKNETEKLFSENYDALQFPDLFFFQPETVIYIKPNSLVVVVESIQNNGAAIFSAINNIQPEEKTTPSELPALQTKFSKSDYLAAVEKIKEHIAQGDFYEMNLCMEFFAKDAALQPFSVFNKLNKINAAPFSALYKNGTQYLICSSPERFLMKEADTLMSQPIKGTTKRGTNEADDALKELQLQNDEKERAENVMIVDLVRNDLAKSCVAGSVEVEELFKVYTFNQVHHLISTIKGNLKQNVSGIAAIKNAFPMGSMTGAPKVMVMQHIEQYEKTRRGLYSGSVGYFTPQGNFDFNVVIRSILFNQAKSYVSFQVGSAITFDSVAEKEYDECMLKADAMMKALQ